MVNLKDVKPTFTMNLLDVVWPKWRQSMCSDEPGATRLHSCAQGECAGYELFAQELKQQPKGHDKPE